MGLIGFFMSLMRVCYFSSFVLLCCFFAGDEESGEVDAVSPRGQRSRPVRTP